MIRLGERLLRDLPVAAEHLGHVGRLVAALIGQQGEVLGQIAQIVLEGLGVQVGVDEDEPAPAADLHLGQAQALGFGLGVREVPLARDLLHGAIEVPAPAVERTTQVLGPLALLGAQELAPVQARVPEPLELVWSAANDEERQVGHVVDEVVAHVGDVVLVAGHLPHALPHLLHLEVMELREK